MSTVLVICVNYHSEADILRFVQQLLKQKTRGSLRILLINNNENAAGCDDISNLLNGSGRGDVIHAHRNLGYYGAAAFGLKHYLSTASLPDWVVVANADIDFPNDGFFHDLDQYYGSDSPAVLAPSIISAGSGADQNPFLLRQPSRRWILVKHWLFSNDMTWRVFTEVSRLKWTVKGVLRRTSHIGEHKCIQIFAPHGAFVLFNKIYFLAGGDLVPQIFLYGEELLIADTSARLGLRIVYDPRLRVIHRGHATTAMSPFIFQCVRESIGLAVSLFSEK
jgi:GT2 family glycosyltransferase